jgi:hypothetical protein
MEGKAWRGGSPKGVVQWRRDDDAMLLRGKRGGMVVLERCASARGSFVICARRENGVREAVDGEPLAERQEKGVSSPLMKEFGR